jgi:pimeloyl-ACP methyl ester carboxylesterase
MLLKLLAVVAGCYLLILVLAFVFQRQLQYFPSHMDLSGKGLAPFAPFLTEDGDFLGYIRQAQTPRRVVVFFHGNGGEALGRMWVADLIPAADVTIILAEYPGYGAKSGKPTEEGIVAAATKTVNEAERLFGKPVTLLGESLGTGVVSAVAHLPSIDRIALISPFTSAAAVGQGAYRWLPVSLLLRDRFDSVARLSKLALPMFVVHGNADMVVPFSLGKALFESYPGKEKYFVELPNTGHNDIVPQLLASAATERFRRYLSDDEY